MAKITDFSAAETNYPRTKIVRDRTFLGIDHTAIVVSNTSASLKFYRDLLGLKLAGESTNYGTEQAHFNNVQDARLHISGLRSISGPGIEFLEYLEPKDGRSLPTDAKPNDLSHWQTTLVVKDATAIAERLKLNGSTFISPIVVTIPGQILGFKNGFLYCLKDGNLKLLNKELNDPNGIAFSPNEKYLYVGNWDEQKKVLMRYAIDSDCRVSNSKVFYDMTKAPGEDAIDGIKVD
jgi:catechol 2,3-dioxygenase-like lactoylglutathione lyase family enzyme